MKVLLVQPYGDNGIVNVQTVYKEIQALLQKNRAVDLIVFPEAYDAAANENKAWETVESVANLFNIPVLMGFSMHYGTEEAYYFNPHVNPEDIEADTERKIYIKHSTAPAVFFDLEDMESWKDYVYAPILLQGQLIQVCICHDMFYPLLMEKLQQYGMDMLINLTGGNVKMSKWNALLKGRSLEIGGPVLCTMGNRTSMGQKSDRIAFNNGHQLKAEVSKFDGTKRHAYSIFNLEKYEKLQQPAPFYSDKQYEQLTIGLQDEDIIFTEDHLVDIALDEIQAFENTESLRVQKGEQTIHIHIGGLDELYDRTFVFKAPRVESEPHVFVYVLDEDFSYDALVALAKIRAIENRIGVVIRTPKYLIGAKTNRYKDVQLFSGESFGFDLEHMNGFDSVYEKNPKSMNGLNLMYKEKYEGLVEV